jgi:3''-phosphoadenosine 5''-phosphosulfate sulfotransferase (PAPS reductase)/FAD synthetase and related enzymes
MWHRLHWHGRRVTDGSAGRRVRQNHMDITTHVALFSGGKDSLVSTHYAFTHFPIDFVAYLDTNSGLPANLEYVRSVCDNQNWPLQVLKSPVTLTEFATKYGFAGPSVHGWAYSYFKERQLRQLANEYGNVVLYSGVRSDESERRMKILRANIWRRIGGRG